jgi:hypothetical protein
MVRFDPAVKSRLTQLGEEDSRSMSRELERPIDNECRRRGHPEPAPEWLLLGSGVMGSGLVVNRPREAEFLGVGPDRDVDPLVALVAEKSESHGGPDQVDEPARRSEVL